MKAISEIYETCTDFLVKNKKIVIPVLYLVLIAVPFAVRSPYFLRVLCLIGVYSVLTMSLNLIAGYMGQTSMGHAALYCLGGYFSGLLGSKLGWPFWITMIFGIIGGRHRRYDPGACRHQTVRLLSGGYHPGIQ